VIVDDLNFISIAGAKNKANTILIIDPNTPLTRSVTFEFLESVARRDSQKRDFGRRVNQ